MNDMFACYLQPHNFDINLVNTVNQAKCFDIRKVGRFKWPTREAINQMTDNRVNCPKKKDKTIFHKKLHRKLKIYLYKGIKYCLI